ncbi:acyltransferase family protein [Methylobacter psychrophilus]|uniref:acyltransferase family protein n=1 Tax=Methylobacter psychrophilus TaxID=96941 RepID=UPI0021D4FC5D|nr:acyltransferase [Methylobacter psychrophilus]
MDKYHTPTAIVFEGIQSLRAIAAIFVLLMHLTFIEQKYGAGKSIMPEVFHYGSIGVDIFFVISGFIMAMITKNLFGTSCEYKFLYKRCIRIFPIYWFYSLLVLGVFLFKPEIVNSTQGNQVNIIKSLLLLPDKNLPLLMVGWSLIYEIYFYFIVTLALRTVKDTRYPLFLIIWAFAVVLISWVFSEFSLTKESPWFNVMTSPLCLEFISGSFIALFYHRVKPSYGVIFLGTGTLVILTTPVYMVSISVPYIPGGWANTAIFGTGAFLLVLGTVVCEQKLKLVLPKWLTKIGDASYSLYLSHILILSALGRAWLLLPFGHSGGGHIVALALIFFLAILWALISYKLIEIPIIAWLNKKDYHFPWSIRPFLSRLLP